MNFLDCLKKNIEKEGYYYNQSTKKFEKCLDGCKKCINLDECLACNIESGFFSIKVNDNLSEKTQSKINCVKKCPEFYVKNNEINSCIN